MFHLRQHFTSAMVTGNVIVVMRGISGEIERSVEYFSLDLYKWEELSPMNERRKELYCGSEMCLVQLYGVLN